MRPTARDIVESVVQAMHDAHEPLDEHIVLVPAIYDVLIHPQAYRELEPILSRIKQQATQRLEGEIERLNRSSDRTFGRFLRPLLRLFYPEHRLRRLMPGLQKIERAGDAWAVDVLVTADHSARIDFLAVETDFGGRVSPVMRGDTGLQLRRRTTRLPEGGYETILITPAGGLRRVGEPRNGTSTLSDVASKTEAGALEAEPTDAKKPETKKPGLETTGRTTGETTGESTGAKPSDAEVPASSPSRAVARLDYEDHEGRHTYYLEKDLIVIGRHDDVIRDLDVALHTQADVSREHAVIRQEGDRFEIKNLGRYGTRVNGRSLEPSGQWHPLPQKAEINLADAVTIRFEALKQINDR